MIHSRPNGRWFPIVFRDGHLYLGDQEFGRRNSSGNCAPHLSLFFWANSIDRRPLPEYTQHIVQSSDGSFWLQTWEVATQLSAITPLSRKSAVLLASLIASRHWVAGTSWQSCFVNAANLV